MGEWFKPTTESIIPIAALGALTVFLAVTGLRKEPEEPVITRQDNLLTAGSHEELKQKVKNRTEEAFFNFDTINKWLGLGKGAPTPTKPITKPTPPIAIGDDEIYEANYGDLQWTSKPNDPWVSYTRHTVTPPWHYEVDYSLTYNNRPYSSQSIAIHPDDFTYQYDYSHKRSTQADYNFGGYFENPGDKSKEHLPWQFSDKKDKAYP